MKVSISTILELLGLALILVSSFALGVWIGLLVCGVALLVLGYAAGAIDAAAESGDGR